VGGQLRFSYGEIDIRNQFSKHVFQMKPQLATFNARADQLQLTGLYATLQTQVFMKPDIMCHGHEVKLATRPKSIGDRRGYQSAVVEDKILPVC